MTKLIKTIALVAVVLSSMTLTASAKIPFVMYGVSAGANVSSIKDTKSGFGYQGGVMLGLDLPIIEISAEGIYSHSKFDFNDATAAAVKCNSIDIPVLLSFPILGPIRLKVGPSFNVYNDSKIVYDFDSSTTDLGSIKNTMGYVAGLGINLFKLTFDVRYNGQFSNVGMSVFNITDQADNTYDIKTNTFSATIGYRF